MNQKNGQAQLSRREREREARKKEAEIAFESFRQALGGFLKGKDLEEAIDGFNTLIDLAKQIGEGEKSSGRRYRAVITLGKDDESRELTFGPTQSLDTAAALAKAWMEAHASVTNREPVSNVRTEEV